MACTPAEGSNRMVNEGLFVSSHRLTWNPAVCHIDPEPSRRNSTSSDGRHPGDRPERRLLAAESIDQRTQYKTKWSGLHALLGHDIDRPDRAGMDSRTDSPRSGNRLHPVRTTRIDSWSGLYAQDQIPVRGMAAHQAVARIRRRTVLYGSRGTSSRRVFTIQFHPDSRRRHLLVRHFTAVPQRRISVSPYLQCGHQVSQHRAELESSLRRLLILFLGAGPDE